MPHATSPHDLQEELDDILIQQALDPENRFDFNRELEPGEKADDAIDFGDLSDDDLAEDESNGNFSEPAENGLLAVSSLEGLKGPIPGQELHELLDGKPNEGDGFDDLFGDNISSYRDDEEAQRPSFSTPAAGAGFAVNHSENSFSQEHARPLPEVSPTQGRPRQDVFVQTRAIIPPARSDAQDKVVSKEQQLQQELFAMSGYGSSSVDYLPPPPANQEELLRSLWPKYERDSVPRFMELLPPKKTAYVRKIPPKRPKTFQPTKLNLELAKDLERSFRLPDTISHRKGDDIGQSCVIPVTDHTTLHGTMRNPEDVDIDPDSEIIKGFTWQDIQILCQDWESQASDLGHLDKLRGDAGPANISQTSNNGGSTTEDPETHVSKVGAKFIKSVRC